MERVLAVIGGVALALAAMFVVGCLVGRVLARTMSDDPSQR